MSELAIGIDMGATHIKGVVIDSSGKILHQLQTDTVDQEGAWKDAVAFTLQALVKKSGVTPGAIGLSAPGLASSNNECIAVMPGRLAGLENFLWSDFLKVPTLVLNDAHAATLAEAKFGAGKGKRDIILLTLGSGVGGGIVINGVLHQGLLQRAGHMGHATVNADTNSQDVTGMPGSIEDAIGNLTVQRRSFGMYANTAELVRAYEEGEPVASLVWLKSVRDLASAISSYINIISPELVILSGGISLAGESLFHPLHAFLQIFEWKMSGARVPIVPAAYGEFAGAIGAAAFALQKQNKLI